MSKSQQILLIAVLAFVAGASLSVAYEYNQNDQGNAFVFAPNTELILAPVGVIALVVAIYFLYKNRG